MKALPALTGVACLAWLCGCVTAKKPEPTPLEIQSYQTREFEVDKALALGSVITVFQDLGYIIQSADKDTGFVTATSPTKRSTDFLDILNSILGEGSTSNTRTRATAFLEEVRPNFTTVRLNFVVSEHGSGSGRQWENDTVVNDPQAYQIAFSKIEDAIFVRVNARQPAAAPAQVPAAQAAQ